MARPTSRKRPARTPDAELRCFGVLIVRPIGRFNRKIGAVPKRCHVEREHDGNFSGRRYAERRAAAYNNQAIAHGWSTWAIVNCDRDGKRYLQAVEDANVTVSGTLSDVGLNLYGFSWNRNPQEPRQLHVSLRCGIKMIVYTPGMDLRAIAIKQVEEVLAAVKAAADIA